MRYSIEIKSLTFYVRLENPLFDAEAFREGDELTRPDGTIPVLKEGVRQWCEDNQSYLAAVQSCPLPVAPGQQPVTACLHRLRHQLVGQWQEGSSVCWSSKPN